MKRLLLIIAVLLFAQLASANIVNNSGSTAADSISFEFTLLDSAATSILRLLVGDTVWMHVYYPSGALAYRDSVVGTASAITEQANSDFWTYTWKRAIADIDGTGKDGLYKVVLNAKDVSLGLPNPFNYEFQLYQTNDFNIYADFLTDSLQAVIDSLQSQSTWGAKTTDFDSLNTVHADANKGNLKATGFSTLSPSDNIGINWADITNQTTVVDLSNTTIALVDVATTVTDGAKEATLANFDTLKYNGHFGLGVHLNSSASNTNTSIANGDGTDKNPVSTLAAARTVADAIGATTYYITGRSSFTLAATHEDWTFRGDGTGNTMNLGSQDVDGSYFTNLTITGTKGGTEDIQLVACIVNNLLLMDGLIFESGIDGTNSIASSDDVFLMGCWSMVAGNGTPVWSFGAGICELNVRSYSGGTEIQNMDGNDGASIEGHGQVVVNANCTAPNITVRGHFTLTDNDGGTTWTRDAVFSRQESDLWIWSNNDTTFVDSSDIGDWFKNNIAGGAGTVTAADIVAIADTIFGRDSADVNAGAVTSFGTLMMNPNYVQGVAGTSDTANIIDAFLRLVATDTTAATMWSKLMVLIDSTQTALADANKGNFKANVSALATAANLTLAIDSINAIIDSLQSQDDWVAREASLFDGNLSSLATAANLALAIDSINAIIDSIQSQSTWVAKEASLLTASAAADAVWDELASGHNTPLSFGDSLLAMLQFIKDTTDAQGSTSGGGADTTAIKSMLYNNLFARLSADTALEVTAGGYVVISSVNQDLDTIARLGDSASFQGGASGLTVQQIVDGVWNELQSAHTTASTFGKYLDTEVSGVSSPAGAGAFSVTWVLIDTSATPDTTVRSAPLYINNVAQSSTPLFQLTDNDGEASFNLDAATWVIFTTEPGLSNNIDTFTVTGAGTDTLFVYSTAGSLTTVAFDLRDANGGFLSGAKVRASLVSVNDSLLSDGTNFVYTPLVVEKEANSSGLALVPMYPNSIFTNDSTYWNVTIYNDRRSNRKQKFRVRVPVSDSVVYVQLLTTWNRDDD